VSGWRSLLAAGVDLLLPADCPACGAPTVALDGRLPFCAGCAPEWQVCPFPARPSPAPDGLPACLAAGSYEGIWRATILSYKDGRRSLSGVLGDALAEVVGHGVGAAPKAWPLVLVPVPSTAAAIRARQGDHMVRLARRAAAALRRFGWSAAVRRPVRALPKADSGHLDRAGRAVAAQHAVTPRTLRSDIRAEAADGLVIVLDDVLTTGSTMAALSRQLGALGAPVAFAATLAATRLRTPSSDQPTARDLFG